MNKMRLFALLLALLPVRAAQSQAFFQTGQNADLMLSGPGFNQTGGPLRFNHPNGLASDGQNLVVCDRFNNRVLVWNTAPENWNDLPDLVLGQPDFDSNDPGRGKDQLNWPGNASAAANGVLAVADTDNDRILIWKNPPTENAQAADLTIELPAISPPGAAQTWGWPWGVWTDGTRLAAVATSGHALLFWNALPTTDNQAPDYVIDLPEFGTPRNISTDGSTFFFVGDHNAKVNGQPGTFFWNSYPGVANQPFDFYRNEWIKGAKLPDGRLVAGGLQSIYVWPNVPTSAGQNPASSVSPAFYKNGDGVDVVAAAGKIFVNNYNGNNVLAYEAPPTGAAPEPVFALGASDFLKNTLDSIGYIQNPALSTDGTRLFVSSDFDRRLYIFNTLPTSSGAMPDAVVSTQDWGLSAWDNACFQNRLVLAGGQRVAVWPDAQTLGSAPPALLFNGNIGSAQLLDLKGVALDDRFFYLADRSGTIYLWKDGIPASASVDPTHTISLPGVQLARLSSDGTYFCVAQQTPPAVLIFKTAELYAGNLSPWKTVTGFGLFNLPAEAAAFEGSLAVANQGGHNVLVWKNIADAGDAAKAIVLGQPDLQTHWPAIGQNRLFMPGALLAESGRLWVGEFKFSSRILRFSPGGVLASPQLSTGLDFRVSPNPASGEVFLPEGVRRVRVFDLTGKDAGMDLDRTDVSRLDVSRLPPGVYLLEILTDAGGRWLGRLVKV